MNAADLTPSRENAFIRRLRLGRRRQHAVALISVVAALFFVATLTPAEIGVIPFYSICVLLMINAFIALRQCKTIIVPIEAMLRRMNEISAEVDNGQFSVNRIYNRADDEFSCLAAGMDELIENLLGKAQLANERALRNIAVVQATPFTFFTVSAAGKVYSVIKDHYSIVPLLGLEAGKLPSDGAWGPKNYSSYIQAVKQAFEGNRMQWFDMHFTSPSDHSAHHLRASVARLNNFSALVVMGDLQAIDRLSDGTPAKSTASTRVQKHLALRRFAASVAHDARNIFTILANLVEINRNSGNPQLVEQSAIAGDAIERGTRMMSELMQYAGETHYRLQRMNTFEAFTKIYSNPTLMALVPDNIKVMVDIAKEGLPDLDLDPDQSWKVTFNLVKNSVEAIGNNPGRIWLRAHPCVMTAEKAKGYRSTGHIPLGEGVITSLTDDGPGISESMLDRLFDPYYSSKGSGRGLGLATVLSIVEAHNGAIKVTSQPGLGSVFEIYLPASRHSEAKLDIIREAAPNGEILLVDDDKAILHTTSLVLRTLKVAAHPAANVPDALRKLRTLRARLKAIVIDAHLEGATNLMATIRTEFPDQTIVLSSGTPEENLAKKIERKLYDRFLAKPYSIAEISAAIK